MPQLQRLDRVKLTYIKRVLGLHTSTKNRLVYPLSDTPLFVEEIRERFSLTRTESYTQFIAQREQLIAEIDPPRYLDRRRNDHFGVERLKQK